MSPLIAPNSLVNMFIPMFTSAPTLAPVPIFSVLFTPVFT